MKTRRHNWTLAFVMFSGIVFAQQPPVKVKNFNASESYDPPHQAQMKFLLQGAEAEPLTAGRYLVKELKLQTFLQDGKRELLVEAPQCVYDAQAHSASSPGRLRVESGDGKLSIEGEGFLWRQTNSSLFISNQVHTFVQPSSETNAQQRPHQISSASPPTAPLSRFRPQREGGVGGEGQIINSLDIFSDQFSYTADSGLGIYRGHVRASGLRRAAVPPATQAGTNELSLTAGLLTIVVPMAERQLRSIVAEENVIMDYEGVQATGQRMRYDAETDLAQISGPPQPTWRAGQREGQGDELLIDHTNKIFRATGHARLKMSGQSAGTIGFLPQSRSLSTNQPNQTNQVIEVICDNYEIRTNLAVFRQQVQVTQLVEDQPQGTMTCGQMTLAFSGTNELQSLVAEENVIIEQQTNRFIAGRAVYSATNGILAMTQTPSWRSGLREGKGDTIQANLRREEMFVRGDAFLRLPADQLVRSSIFSSAGAGQTNSGPAAQQFAEITCEQYTLGPQAALFQNHVHLEHPQMQLRCETINAQFPSDKTADPIWPSLPTPISPSALKRERGAVGGEGHPLLMVAEHGVVIDLTDEKGEKVHGTSEKAVYSSVITGNVTNNLIELTGNPLLQTTNGTIQNAVIILDLAKHTLLTPGRFKIRGLPSTAGTNRLVLPKLQPRAREGGPK